MTIDELMNREKELETQEKCELELRASGIENGLSVQRIGQELLEIKAQIRDMASMSLTKEDGQDVMSAVNYFIAKQKVFKLPPSGRPLDAKSAGTYAELREEIAAAFRRLPAQQRGAMYLSLKGYSLREAAKVFNCAKGTMRFRVNAAKKKVLSEAELNMTRRRLLAGGPILDMRNPDVLDTILMVLTPTQAACFYLYYSENLAFRTIGAAIGCNANAPFSSILQALQIIDILLGEQDVILEHPEVLDERGYAVYRELCTRPELIQAAASQPRPHFRQGRECLIPPGRAVTMDTVHVHVWRQTNQRWRVQRNTPEVPHGRLLAALMKDGKDLFEELKTVFSVCRYMIEQRMASNAR